MRINHADTFAIYNILHGHVLNENRFTAAGFTDRVEVTAAVFPFHANNSFFTAIDSSAKNNTFFRYIGWWGRVARAEPVDIWRFGAGDWHVPKTSHLFG